MKVVRIARKPSYINFPEKVSLEDMYKAIGCRLVQYINLPKITELVFGSDSEYELVMVCDEEGKLSNKPIYNTKATALFMYEYGETDIIAGKVLLLKTDRMGNTLSLDDVEINRLRYVLKHRVIQNATHRILVKLCWNGLDVF